MAPLRCFEMRARGKTLPRPLGSKRTRTDDDGSKPELTDRDDCKATRLFVFVIRLGEVRVPQLALLSQADTLTSFSSLAAAAT